MKYRGIFSLEFLVTGLSIWVGILSLMLTLHAEVFFRSGASLKDMLTIPFQAFQTEAVTEADLASIISDRQTSSLKPLYIFALDTSGSMKSPQHDVTPEWRRLLQAQANSTTRATARCNSIIDNKQKIAPFGLAKLETCRFISYLPAETELAFWSFADEPIQVFPDPTPDGDLWRTLVPTDGGGTNAFQILDNVINQKPDGMYSDFEILFERLTKAYAAQLTTDRDIHIVILSDFAHENKYLGLKNNEDESYEGDFAFRQRLSQMLISERVQRLSQHGVTFHMAAVRNSELAICEVLPIADDVLEVFSYRKITLDPSRNGDYIDFLKSIRTVEEPFIFTYTYGASRPNPVELRIGSEAFRNRRLKVALAKLSPSADVDLKVRMLPDRESRVSPRVVTASGHSWIYEVERVRDVIQIQPLSILPKSALQNYRLLISIDSQDSTAAAFYTYAIPIEFQQQLSEISAAGVITCLLSIALILVVLSFRLVIPLGKIIYVAAVWSWDTVSKRTQKSARRIKSYYSSL